MVQEGCVGRRMLPGGMGRVVSPSCGPRCCLSVPKTCTRPPTPARDGAGSPITRRTSATATPSAGGTAAAAGITTGTADPVEKGPRRQLTPTGFSRSQDAITDQDLLRISEQLYKADHNKAQPTDITLNPQHQASPDETGDQEDRSPQPLYKYVNEKLFSKPTYSSFIKLLDNYQRATGREEEVTAEELREQDNFLKEVMKTELMKKLFAFLHEKNRYGSEQEFVADLKEMWFGLYSRGNGEEDSSGFEHVFSGEVKKGKVSGFHNWIRFYLLEKQGIVNYFSHNFNGPWDTYPDVLGLQFSWDGFYKEVGSAFIGCSPEFEFGLYTLCFIAQPGRACHLSLGGYSLSVQTYTWTKSTYGDGKKYIATAYVISP